MKKKRSILPIILLLIVSLVCGLYPLISNLQHKQLQKQMISNYQSAVEETAPQDLEKEWDKAREYNRHIAKQTKLKEPFAGSKMQQSDRSYENILNLNGDGVMGYIEIPKIEVKLPIVHGTDDEDLERAAGHLPKTSFPVGGTSSHSVLSAHRGLPSAKLFTDLDQLEENDIFLLHILDKELYYRVVQIKVVEPENTEDLRIVKGKDYVTLVTCTPYAVNSHRLLVRGERTTEPPNYDVKFSFIDFLRLHFYGVTIGIIAHGSIIAIAVILNKTHDRKS